MGINIETVYKQYEQDNVLAHGANIELDIDGKPRIVPEITPIEFYKFDTFDTFNNHEGSQEYFDLGDLALEFASKLEMGDFYIENDYEAKELMSVIDFANNYFNVMRSPSGLELSQSSTLAHRLRVAINLIHGLGLTKESGNLRLRHELILFSILHDALDEHGDKPEIGMDVRDNLNLILSQDKFRKLVKIHELMDQIEEYGEMMHCVTDLVGVDPELVAINTTGDIDVTVDRRDFSRAIKAIESLCRKDKNNCSKFQDVLALFHSRELNIENGLPTAKIDEDISNSVKLIFFQELPTLIAVHNGEDNLGMISFMTYIANMLDGLRFPKRVEQDPKNSNGQTSDSRNIVNPLLEIVGEDNASRYVSGNNIQDAFELNMMLMIAEATTFKAISEIKRLVIAWLHHYENGMPFSNFSQIFAKAEAEAKAKAQERAGALVEQGLVSDAKEEADGISGLISSIKRSIQKQKISESGFYPMKNLMDAYQQLVPIFESGLENAAQILTQESITAQLSEVYDALEVEGLGFTFYEPAEYDRLYAEDKLPKGAVKVESRIKSIASTKFKLSRESIQLHSNHPDLQQYEFFSREWCLAAIPLLPDLFGVNIVVNGLEELYEDPENQTLKGLNSRNQFMQLCYGVVANLLSNQNVRMFRDYRMDDWRITGKNSRIKTDGTKGEINIMGQPVAEIFPRAGKFNHLVFPLLLSTGQGYNLPGEIFVMSPKDDFHMKHGVASHVLYKIKKFIGGLKNQLDDNFLEDLKMIHKQALALQ